MPMTSALRDSLRDNLEAFRVLLDAPLRTVARRALRVWFNRERLDQVLAASIKTCPHCELIYAINPDGHQMSSNIYASSIDHSAYGQDLSQRPYSVTLSILNNAAYQGAFVCDIYVSQVTQRPCVTVMCAVTSGPTVLGFVAADLGLHSLPAA
jgi:hypothetical protein